MKRLLKLNWVTTLLLPSARCLSVSVKTWAGIKTLQTCPVKWSWDPRLDLVSHLLHWSIYGLLKGVKKSHTVTSLTDCYCASSVAVFFPRLPGTSDLLLGSPQRRRSQPQAGPPSCSNPLTAWHWNLLFEPVVSLVELQLWFFSIDILNICDNSKFWHQGKATCWQIGSSGLLSRYTTKHIWLKSNFYFHNSG